MFCKKLKYHDMDALYVASVFSVTKKSNVIDYIVLPDYLLVRKITDDVYQNMYNHTNIYSCSGHLEEGYYYIKSLLPLSEMEDLNDEKRFSLGYLRAKVKTLFLRRDI